MLSTDSGFLSPYLSHAFPWLYQESNAWTLLGFIASFMFSGRFLIQWYHSEKHQRIIVPTSFWYFSFVGSLLQLVYFLHVDKAPLILSYVFLHFVNARSLIIHLRKEAEKNHRSFH